MHQSKEAQGWIDVDQGVAATLGKARATVIKDISANLIQVDPETTYQLYQAVSVASSHSSAHYLSLMLIGPWSLLLIEFIEKVG